MRLKTVFLAAIFCAATAVQAQDLAPLPTQGFYRLPFADGTSVKVFDDFASHRPAGRVDLYAVGGTAPYRVVAAAGGRIMAIQDRYSVQQSGRPAKDCRDNYVWIAHANGEWTNYAHLAHGSVSNHLRIGDVVKAGDYLGDEGAVGCAMLKHVHFEVAVPQRENAIDDGGFLLDNDLSKRERDPSFCGVPGGRVVKGATYKAVGC
ncbi:MAG TPA: M23 family metallopeptidase [Rhizomicrobium sp.]|jgi:murein DD-endopeptidase MepM/ murein hydrolase activator NlpD|nr:M23 family metallopeptidase [Rhizomicrobium sp.]